MQQERCTRITLLRCRGLFSLQGLLDSYYSKAMAAGEDEKRQAECTKQAGQIVDAFNELLPVRAAEKRASAAAAAAHASSKKGPGKKHDRKGKKGAGAGNVGEKGPKGGKRTLQQSKHAGQISCARCEELVGGFMGLGSATAAFHECSN